jgi:hypothetical protein
MSARIGWPVVVRQAAEIAGSYDTPVTLRQLFYRLVAALILPNSQYAYKQLSARTAEARRDGWFPDLIDQVRTIHRDIFFDGHIDALQWLTGIYRRDRWRLRPLRRFWADADAVGESRGVVGGQRPGQHDQVGDPRVADLVPGEPARAADLDVAAVRQAGQVGRNPALGQADVGHALGHGVLGGQQELQQPQPGRIPQRAEESGHQLHPAGRRWQQRRGRRARGRRSRPRVSRPRVSRQDRGKCLLSHGSHLLRP